MLQAILAKCIMSVMIAHYQAEKITGSNRYHPNEYVDLYWEISKHLGWMGKTSLPPGEFEKLLTEDNE